MVYGLRSRSDELPATFEEAKNVSVGTLRSGAIYDYLLAEGFTNLVEINSVDKYMPLIVRNRFLLFPFLDFFLSAEAERQKLDVENYVPLFELKSLRIKLYIAASNKTDVQAVRRLQRAFQAIKKTKRYIELRLSFKAMMNSVLM